MAIYHFSVKNISRSDGRSVVAAAAYRSAEKLICHTYGKEQDYTKKTGVEFKKIYAPSHTDEHLLDRQILWNEVEKSELKKNGEIKATAQLAREFEIAFPQELSQAQRQKMLDELCKKIVERHGVVVDACIHAPHTASGSDERNYHAHILLTTRSINERGTLGKKTREFNDQGKQQVEHWREQFAALCNQHLEQVGSLERVDHRSYKAQGLELEATQHEGSKVTQLRRQGIDTEISLKNDAIKVRNAEKLEHEQLIKGLNQEIIFAERALSRIQLEQAHLKLEHNKLQQQTKPVESQPQTKKATATDAQNAIAKYNKAIEEVANKVFQELQAQQIEDAKAWLAKIEDMRVNTPIFIGKKAHLAKIDQEVAQYEKMRSNFAKFKETGVTDEHRETAIAIIEKTKPNMALNARNSEKFLTERQLDQAREQLNPNISILAKINNSYFGKVLQSGIQGTVQNTKDGLVYHPQIKDLNTGKEYTLTYTENQVKIQENIEIIRNHEKSKDNDSKMQR